VGECIYSASAAAGASFPFFPFWAAGFFPPFPATGASFFFFFL